MADRVRWEIATKASNVPTAALEFVKNDDGSVDVRVAESESGLLVCFQTDGTLMRYRHTDAPIQKDSRFRIMLSDDD